MDEALKEDEVLMLTYIEDDIEDFEATSSKHPQRRIRTKSMVKEELQFQEKDKIFTTYERRSRKHQHGQKKKSTENSDEEPQRYYVYSNPWKVKRKIQGRNWEN